MTLPYFPLPSGPHGLAPLGGKLHEGGRPAFLVPRSILSTEDSVQPAGDARSVLVKRVMPREHYFPAYDYGKGNYNEVSLKACGATRLDRGRVELCVRRHRRSLSGFHGGVSRLVADGVTALPLEGSHAPGLSNSAKA